MQDSKQTQMTPTEAYLKLIDRFMRVGTQYNAVSEKRPFAKEVMTAGQEYLKDWLEDEDFLNEFEDPIDWYYAIAQIAFAGGIYYAHQWHMDLDFYQSNDLYLEITKVGIFESIEEFAPLTQEIQEQLCTDLFELFLSYLNDTEIRQQKDQRGYIFNGLLAFFHLGMTVVLSKEGM